MLGKFTTCTRCKLGFAAAASERERPSAQQRELEPQRDVDPSRIHPVLPIVLGLVAALGIAAVVWARSTRTESLDRRARLQLRMTVLAAHTRLHYASAGPSCAQLGVRIELPPCRSLERAERVLAELAGRVTSLASVARSDLNVACEVAVLVIDQDRDREGCE